MGLKLKAGFTNEDASAIEHEQAYAIVNTFYNIDRTLKVIVIKVDFYHRKAAYTNGKKPYTSTVLTPTTEEFDTFFSTGNPFNKVDDYLLTREEFANFEKE